MVDICKAEQYCHCVFFSFVVFLLVAVLFARPTILRGEYYTASQKTHQV